MNIDEIRMKCKRKGFLDANNKYIECKTKKEVERREKINRFLKENNITCDDMLAFISLAEHDNIFKSELLKLMNSYGI